MLVVEAEHQGFGDMGLNGVNKEGVRRVMVAWLIASLIKMTFPHGNGTGLRPSFALCEYPSSSCSSTADEASTSGRDAGTWWETVIECASNTSQAWLQELDMIDWLPALRLLIPSLLSISREKALQRSRSHRSGRFCASCQCGMLTCLIHLHTGTNSHLSSVTQCWLAPLYSAASFVNFEPEMGLVCIYCM